MEANPQNRFAAVKMHGIAHAYILFMLHTPLAKMLMAAPLAGAPERLFFDEFG